MNGKYTEELPKEAIDLAIWDLLSPDLTRRTIPNHFRT